MTDNQNPQIEEALQLIHSENDDHWVSSLDVAAKFNKEHRHVLEAVRNLQCSQRFTESNFRLSEYTDSTGRKLPMFLMNRKGFSMLAMGFTGKQAAEWREAFIEAFEMLLTKSIAPKTTGDMLVMLAEQYRDVERQQAALKQEINQIVSGIDNGPLDTVQKRNLFNVIQQYGKRLESTYGKKAYSLAQSSFKNKFGLRSYDELPKWKIQEALDWLKSEIDSNRPFTPVFGKFKNR